MQKLLVGDRTTLVKRAVTGIVIVGAALRVVTYLAGRSLWLDEAMLANNIVGRNALNLLGPLGESQTAPWLFLLAERAASVLLGRNELALRLVPLLCGVVLPWVVWLAASRLAGRNVGLIAAAVTALSPLLLYYANEVKPYGIDALVTAALLVVTLRVLDDPDTRASWMTLLGVGAVSLLASFPAICVVAACWCALIAAPAVRASRHARPVLAACALVWSATFALPYVIVIRGAATDAFLTNYFSDRFLVPWQSNGFTSLWRLWRDLATDVFFGRDAVGSIPDTALITSSICVLGLCVAGVREVKRRRGLPGVVLVVGPVVLALIASTFRQYPLTARLWTFSAPLWAMLAAAGVVNVAGLARRPRSVAVGALVTAGLLLSATVDAGVGLTRPYWRRAHMRPLIRALEAEQRTTGDAIYVMPRATPQWLFYTTPWRTDPAPVRRDSAAVWLERRTCGPTTGRRACQILGEYSSVQYTEVGGFAGRPDTAWANREMARVRGAATPCAWVLMHLPYPGEPAALANAVQAQGGRVDNAMEDRQHPNRDAATKAFRVCFGTAPNGAT